LAFLVAVMQHDGIQISLRLSAAKALMSYCHHNNG
jgi:hypothetical protein